MEMISGAMTSLTNYVCLMEMICGVTAILNDVHNCIAHTIPE